MTAHTPSTVYLKDYTPPTHLIDKTFLTFELDPVKTTVRSKLEIRQNPEATASASLRLHGQELTLKEVKLNGSVINASDYTVDDESLELHVVPAAFTLEIVTEIAPEKNTSLEGLYKSRTMYCTQCEAEGFRKITYYLDRPDVLSEFTTTIIADQNRFPVLLSNGNCIDSQNLADGLHSVSWHDPFRKPAYLFALVAGDLSVVEDSFTTCSNREVALKIFVEPKDLDKCDHAMQSLKNSMKWDEDVYGREYDLDIFMIVAVDDFNMGAMENKGLNIFNTSCVLAHPKTTTDAGFARVEGVVAHEYFHNWSGNRVTCRDWFQLSLKEGFTVFRDEEFSSDMGSRTVKRVEDVNIMRTMQFAEDAGPMAHPVQPPSYMEISNFYTLTVYEKGAEVVRMYHTLLGPELFRKACDIYFERNDGKAATIEDFIAAMAEVSGRDFTQFKNWYTQAGTPVVTVSGDYDSEAKTFKLQLTQSCPDTPEAKGSDKAPYHIPVNMTLLGENGPLPLKQAGKPVETETVLELTEPCQTFTFEDVDEAPVPALLRGFSAPVKLAYPYKKIDLLRIATTDTDGFARYDAFSQLAVVAIFDVMAALRKEESWSPEPLLLDGFKTLLTDESLDEAMVALMCTLPSEAYLSGLSAPVEVDLIHKARNMLALALSVEFKDLWQAVYARCSDQSPYAFNAPAVAKRSLKNVALDYLMIDPTPETIELCTAQFESSDNMTDQYAALRAMVNAEGVQAQEKARQLLAAFYSQWQEEALVVNLWLSVQAANPKEGAIERIHALMAHPAFDANNPNKLRSVIGVFTNSNAVSFHHNDGSGYSFLADQILKLNKQNPQVASRLLAPLTKWKKYDANRQQLMKAALERIASEPALSKDVYEVVAKSLGN